MTLTSDPRTAQRWVLALTSVASFMVALDQLVVAAALSTIHRDLHASLETLDWTVNSYGLSFAVLLITGAALGDRLGRRRMFVAGLSIFTLASIGCALAPTVGWLIAARAVQGAGSALVMPLAMALLSAAYPPERRGAALGIFAALTGLAVAGGPVVGGAVTQGLAWQWIFWINVPIGVVAIGLAPRVLAESRGPRARLDLPGIALAGGGMFGVVWALVRGNTAGWTSPEILGTLLGGALLIAAFVGWELRAEVPMLPMRYFRVSAFSGGTVASLLLFASLTGAVFFFAQYLQVSLGYRPLAAGVRFLPWTLALFFVAPLAGRLTDRIGARPLLVAGLSFQGAGMLWTALNIADGRPYSASIVALVIAGCGTSMAMPAGQNAVLGAVPMEALGKASGTYGTVRQLGGSIGISALSALFAIRGSYTTPADFADGASVALAASGVLALLGAVAGLFTPGRRLTPMAVPLPAARPARVG